MKDELIILLLALAFDLLWGEPPNALHPVVWMGRWIGWAERHGPTSPARACVFGGLLVFAGVCAVIILALSVEALRGWQTIVHMAASAYLLKSTFAIRALIQAALEVRATLSAGNLAEARRLLSWHLVSRDTCELDERLVAAATVESVAENFGDGIVAPLFYFALFGLPGAVAYRFANTADAMLGYRDARHEYLGKFAARFDDLLNLLPARLAALALMCASIVLRADAAQAWRILWRNHARTASPNAGWPMSAMAGALDVTLEKVGHYQLGDGVSALDAQTVTRSLNLLGAASIIFVFGVFITLQVKPW